MRPSPSYFHQTATGFLYQEHQSLLIFAFDSMAVLWLWNLQEGLVSVKPISLCKGPDKIVRAQCTEDCLLPKCDHTCSSSLSSRYGTRRCPSRGTLFGSSSTWRTATFTPRSSAPSITKQKCWTQQRWAQRLYKSERSIRTKEPMPKSTTLFRQVRAMQQGSLGYEHASASVL